MKLRIEVLIGDVPDLVEANAKLRMIVRERQSTSQSLVKIRAHAEEIVDYVADPVLVNIGVISLVEIVEHGR